MRELPKFRNPHINRLVGLLRLDRQRMSAIATKYYFPIELLDNLDDFLEAELAKILTVYRLDPNKQAVDLTPSELLPTDFFTDLFTKIEIGDISLSDRDYYHHFFGITTNDIHDHQQKFRTGIRSI